ncbi:MAG: hypothetical protein LBR73_01375 [Oscillospiraceae bacterium]|jgi:hypothetical protein|nr:hypothetical protein [Oscillospiraceae bacterium]
MRAEAMPSLKAKRETVLLVCVFAFFAVIGFLTIIDTYDDWFWGSADGLREYLGGLKNTNGRWLGNAAAMALTRSRLVAALCYGTTGAAVVWSLPRLAGLRGVGWELATLLTLMCTAAVKTNNLWHWLSCFGNYTLPLAILLPVLVLVRRHVLEEKELPKAAYALLPLVFAAQLFMEHYTICFTIALLMAAVYASAKHRRPDALLLSFALTALAGAVLMFLHPVYWYAIPQSTQTGIHQYSVFGSLTEFVSGIVYHLLHPKFGFAFGFLSEWFFCFAVGGSLLYFFLRVKPKGWRGLSALQCVFLFRVSYVLLIGDMFTSSMDYSNGTRLQYTILTLRLLLLCAELAAAFYALWHFPKARQTLRAAVFCAVSAAAPLLFVYPIPSRVWFLPLLFTYAALFRLAAECRVLLPESALRPFFKPLLAFLCAMISIASLAQNGRMFLMAANREKDIQAQIAAGNQTIFVSYIAKHTRGEAEKTAFRARYNLPKDTQIIFLKEGETP